MSDMFMNMTSRSSYRDDELITRYVDAVEMIVVDLGSGSLFLGIDDADVLFEQLREAINDARLVLSERSGESAHLVGAYREITVVAAEDAAERRRTAAAELKDSAPDPKAVR